MQWCSQSFSRPLAGIASCPSPTRPLFPPFPFGLLNTDNYLNPPHLPGPSFPTPSPLSTASLLHYSTLPLYTFTACLFFTETHLQTTLVALLLVTIQWKSSPLKTSENRFSNASWNSTYNQNIPVMGRNQILFCYLEKTPILQIRFRSITPPL